MIARALVFLIAGGLLALRAGAQPPPPVCDTCVNPVTITITPTTPTTDTLRSRSETISICASPLVSDSAEWNGATITGLTISNGCATKTASYTYHVGSNKWQAWGCSGLGGGDNKGECINQSLSIQHPALGVNPKGTTVDVADSTIAKELFTVSNYDTASHTYTLTLTCTSTVTSCSASPASSITVNPGLQGTDTVTYRAGATGTTGTIQLKATAAGNSDSAIVTVRAISALTVSTAFMNQDDQDMTRCAVSCFAATTGLSTVPIISKGLPRGISLVYHGDRVAVRPFLYMDVTASNSTPALQDLQLTAQYQVNGSWIAMTFVNGDRTLHFAGSQLNAKPADTFRLGAQVDVSSLASTAWAAAPLKITLVAVYSDHQEFYTDSSQTLSVVSERASPIAAGWSVAGVPHLYGRSDNTASQIVVKEGNGSTTLYNGNNCVPNCIWMPAGPGVFSRIDYLWGAPDSMVYIRSYPDSTREYFYGSRVNSGAIGRRVDRFQDTVLFKYDTLGRLDSITDPYRTASGAHLAWQIKYGPNGIDSIIEPLTAGVSNARKTTDSVDVNHLLRKWTDPDGASTRFGYDADNRLNSITDRNGNTTTFKYDTLWNLDTIVSPQVPIDNHGTGSPTNQSLMTVYQDWQEAGVPYKHTSDSVASQWQPARTDTIRGRTTDPLGYVHAIQPDRWGQALALTDPLGNTMTYARDQNGMPETVTYPTGAQDQFTFSGPLLTQSTPAYQTVTTYYAYGPFAIPDSVYGTGIPTTYNYFTVAGRGRIDSTRVGAGNKATHYTYDNFFRVTQAVDPLGDTTHMGYDAISGNLDSSQALPSQRLATTTFDHVGRDSIDVVTSYTIRQSTTKLYDPMNRVIGLLDGVHTGDTIKYHYDSLYLRSTTDLKGQVYQTTYNPLGWPVTQVDPANRTTTATYNALGLPMTATNRRGQMMTYSYDITGRLTGVHKPSVRSEADAADTVVYSVTGDVVRDSNAVQKNVTYVSDASNWTDSTITYFVTHGTWWKRHYFHSALGQIDSIVFTTNATGAPPHTRHFGWDAAAGVLDSIWVGTTAATHLGYNALWMHTTTTYPTSVIRTDSISQILGLVSSTYSTTNTSVFNRGYDYDSAGRITEVDLPNGTSELYTYNGTGQLAEWITGHWMASDSITCWKTHGEMGYPCGSILDFSVSQQYDYSFDLADNLDTVKNVTGGTDTLGVFGTGNTDSLWKAVSVTHDNDGDRATNGSATSYVWSADGRLLQAITAASGNDTSVYDYNVAGQLTRRQKHGVDDRYYLWDHGQLVAILDQWAEDVSAEYAYYPGTDRLFAQGVPSLSTLSYYEQDGKGNVVGVHTNGVANQTLSYDPWGNLESLSSSGSDTTQLRWKGLLWEEGPKLYYMRARWYDPVTRRFVSPDPLGLAAGINQYAFAGGDPINGSDPGGMEACDGGDDSSDEYFCDPGGGDNGPGTAATCTLQTPIAECFAPINNDPAVVLTYDWAQYIGIGGDFGTTLVLTTDDLAIYNTVGAGTGLDQGPSLMGGVATSANAVSDASTTVCGGDGAAACYSGNPSGSVYLIGAQSGAGGHGGTTYSVLMFSLQTFWHQLTNSVNQWAQGFFNNPYNNPCAVFADAC